MTKPALLLALLLAAQPALAARKHRPKEDDEPKTESYSSMQMEARAIMGELKYQHGDIVGANDTFHDSLNDSRAIASPTSPVVALDLYRTAEIAARRGDFETARERLDILTSRYGDSEYAAKGRELQRLLPRKPGPGADTFSPVTAVVTANQPEFLLGRIQALVRARRDDDALDLCREFLRRLPTRPEAQEVRLLGAALYIRLGDAKGAERALSFLAQRASDAEVRAKAVHLLGALQLTQGRNEAVLQTVPDTDPRRSVSTWLSRAQAWRAAAERALGRESAAARREAALADSQISSPARAYALAGLAQDADLRHDERQAQTRLAQAADEARRWGMEDLSGAAELGSAHSLYKQQRFAEAASAYGAFSRRHPDSPQRGQALFQQGLSLKRLGRREQAVAAFSEIAQKLPRSVYAQDAHLQLGQLYDELGADDKAVAEYKAMGADGERRGMRESLLLRAQVHYNAKRFKQAIPLYWQFLEDNPQDKRRAEIEDLLLTSYWMGARDDARLLEAAERFPRHPIVQHIRWELGASAYKKGDYALAAQWLSRFAADYPKSAHAADSLFFTGEALLQEKDAAGAAKAYRGYLSAFPKGAQAVQARARLAAALYQSGDFLAAAAAYGALEQRGGGAQITLARAQSLEKAGQASAARSEYELFARKYPKSAEANEVWLKIAEGREQAGRLAAAADAYERVKDDAHHAGALFQAGRLREKMHQSRKAVSAYQALRRTKPAAEPLRVRGLVRLGLLLETLDRPLDAMGAYAEVIKLAPRGGDDWKAAAQRLEALSKDGSLVRNGR